MTNPTNAPIGPNQATSLPSFDIVDPAGRRRRVHPNSTADTVADLALALGCTDGHGITIGGLPVGSARALTTIAELVDGVHVGRDRVAASQSQVRACVREEVERGSDVGVDFAIVAGPVCRPWAPLPSGRHGLGRSPEATIRVVDPLAEVHHAVLVVDDDGSITLTQLTGRVPMVLIRAPPAGSVTSPVVEPVCSSTSVGAGDAVLVGSSRVEFRRRAARAVDEPGDATRAVPPMRGTLVPIAGDPWHLEVHRAPAGPTDPPAERLVPPSPEPQIDMPAATALVGAAIAVVGAVVIAGILRQTMFAMFAAVGAVASCATWAAGALTVWRRRRAARHACRLDRARFASEIAGRRRGALERHRRRHAEISDVLAVLAEDRSSVWHRRPVGGELDVVIGRGSCRITSLDVDPAADDDTQADVESVVERAAVMHDVAIPIRLGSGDAVAVRGDAERVHSLLRSVIVQIGCTIGPADVRIVVIGEAARWDWVEWLPHVRAEQGGGLVAPADIDRLADLTASSDAVSASETPATLLIIDEPALLAVRTGPLRRFMSVTGAATLVAVAAGATSPAVCRRTLAISSTGTAEWANQEGEAESSLSVLIAGLDESAAASAARALAPLVDPEMGGDFSGRLPEQLTLASVDEVTAAAGAEAIARRWRDGGADPSLRAPIGTSVDGLVEVDLVADGPHALVAGTTGSGKSELLRTLVVSMASRVSPEHLTFVLIDYKGGSTFDSCADLPHTVGLVTDLDDGLAHRALVSLEAELSRRERMLRSRRVGDLTEYRRREPVESIPRLVVVVDEFATLAHDLPDFLRALVAIAQRGRSLGVHIVLATQRPAGVVTDDIRANTDLRLALRVNDATEARDIVGDARPAVFPKSLPGRAMLRLANDEPIVFQAARCTGPVSSSPGRLRVVPARPTGSGQLDPPDATGSNVGNRSELVVAVEAIRVASAMSGVGRPRRPWLDPLPATLDHAMVDETVATFDVEEATVGQSAPERVRLPAIGVIDDPANQRRSPLRWDHTAGHLVLLGSLGSGRTSTIVALVTAMCRPAAPRERHVYVIDGDGDRSLDALASVAHCGGVVRVGEAERIDRLLRRLTDEIDRRSASAVEVGPLPHVAVFIDGLAELRRSLDVVDRLASLAMLDRMLDAGPAVGVTSCVTWGDGTLPSMLAAAEHWVFRLDGPDGFRGGGSRARADGAQGPGRLRIAASGLDAQVAFGADGLAELPSNPHIDGPRELMILPTWVDRAMLRPSHTVSDAGRPVRHLVIGLACDDLESTAICVPDGDHVLVGGAARTGVSTTLERIASEWEVCGQAGSAPPVVLRWRGDAADVRAVFAERAGTPILLVVDDAERVQDRDGLFAEIVRGEHQGVTVAAGARLDAVRAAYGHWTREVARSRCGLVMTAAGEIDGDLFGTVLPRRAVVAHRPGLAWVIDGVGHRLVQVAGRMPT